MVVTNTTASLAYVRFGADPDGRRHRGRHAGAAQYPRDASGQFSLIAYAAAVLTTGSGTVLFSRGDGSFL